MKQRQTPAWILIYSELFGLLYFLHPFVNLIRIYWKVPQARLGFWKIFCCCSVIKMCPTLWDPMDCSTPGLPDLLYLPEFAQTHVSWVGDVIQPSHLLLPPSPPALNLCQNQGLFQWVFPSGGQSTGASTSASVLPMNIQGLFPLGLTSLISLLRDSQASSPAPQFESINSFVLSLLYGLTLTPIHDYWKNHSFDYPDLCQQSDVSAF